jgi:hypothetical protein
VGGPGKYTVLANFSSILLMDFLYPLVTHVALVSNLTTAILVFLDSARSARANPTTKSTEAVQACVEGGDDEDHNEVEESIMKAKSVGSCGHGVVVVVVLAVVVVEVAVRVVVVAVVVVSLVVVAVVVVAVVVVVSFSQNLP